ncbi:hypothetical protein R6Q59_028034 [Mikania micrantha]
MVGEIASRCQWLPSLIKNTLRSTLNLLNAAHGEGQLLVRHVAWHDALSLIPSELDAHDDGVTTSDQASFLTKLCLYFRLGVHRCKRKTALKIKPIHNLGAYLVKSSEYPHYNEAIDTLFWANSSLVIKDDYVESITSVVAGQQVTVTPTKISVALNLNDTEAPTTVSLKLLHNAFVQCDYQGDLKNRTLYKAFFYPKYKFLYHTIL